MGPRADKRRLLTSWAARLVASALCALGLLIAVPSAALAHAVLVSSNPAAGADLAVPPAVVTLVFDEPLVASLSKATVAAPNGRTFTSTVVGKTMKVRLSGSGSGVYRVDWKTVSQVDGHTITGSFSFGVGVAVAASAGTSSPAPGAGDITLSVLRGIEYAVLLLACGMALLARLGRDLPLRQPTVTIAAALLASGVVVVCGEAVLASSGWSARGFADYLSNGTTGWARVGRLVLEAALLVFVLLRRRLSVVLLAGIVGAVAVAGHGADVEPAWQGIAVNAGHLAAAAVWAGGILALGLLRLQGYWGTVRAAVLPRFSRVAPWAFAVSVGLGAVQATELLASPQPVLGTSYGLTLVAKAVAITAIVPLSVLAWWRSREHVRGEAALALVVIAAAAALAAFPVVPKEAREAAEEQPAPTSREPGFPQPGDLTIGGRAGDVMVALSLHPAKPGANTATVYLAPPATRKTAAHIRVSGRTVALQSCGPTCRRATVELHGSQTVEVVVPGHGSARYSLPALPAETGRDVVSSAVARMDRLHTYRVDENLSGIRSRYVYATPHQMFVRTWFGNGPQDTLWIGPKLYRRVRPDAPWKLQARGELAPAPYFVWNPFKPLADIHVVGTSHVGGRLVTVLTAFGGHGDNPQAVWFTLYVDEATHTVLRSQMWAPNHFMDDRFVDLNRPVHLPNPGPAG